MSAPSLQSAAMLAAERPLEVWEAMGVLRDAATALATAHAAGAVHGAVCSENIVLDAAGAARLCRDVPAPALVSPEQRRGEPPDARSDVYGLGAAILELLGGERVPEPVERLLALMAAEEPSQRPQSMEEVLLGLEACELMTRRRAVRPGQRPEPERPHRRRLGLLVLALALLVLGLAVLALRGRTPPPEGKPPASYKGLLDKTVPIQPTTKP